jgi:putative PIN family toxin of toxin-antitoxin system
VRIILDTNVFVSGVFFTGPPYQILNAWRNGAVQLVLSPEILDEYERVGSELGAQFREVDIGPFLALAAARGEMRPSPPLPGPVCRDPDDDKFLACALAANVKRIVSGDGDLLSVSGYCGIEIIKPGEFVRRYLRATP